MAESNMAEANDSVEQDSTPTPRQTKGSNGKRKRLLLILATIVVVGIVAYTAYWFFYSQFHESTEDAYVQGNVISISPQVSGTVVAIRADDTDRVHAGDVLVQLDDTDAKVALAQAEARLAETVRQVRRMFDQAQQMQATVTLRKASLDQARRDFQRAQKLQKVRGISTEDFQHAQTALHTANASYQVAKHQLAASQAAVAGTTLENHPQVKQSAANLRQAWLALQRTRILAPANGYVAQRSVQLGQQVQPGSKLMAVIPLKQVWVDANFKETALTNVRIGQPVELTSDLYGDSYTYHGKVIGLAAGTGSAFALLPPQNATGNWIKIVQRVPVRVGIDPRDLDGHPLRIGLSMTVDIDTHDRDGHTLAPEPATGSGLTTPVYQRDQDKVDALIERIIKANRGQA